VSNFPREIEFGASQFVERLDLEGLPNGTRKSPFRLGCRMRDRIGYGNDAHPVSNPEVSARHV